MNVRIERLVGMKDLVVHDALWYDVDTAGNLKVFGDYSSSISEHRILAIVPQGRWLTAEETE